VVHARILPRVDARAGWRFFSILVAGPEWLFSACALVIIVSQKLKVKSKKFTERAIREFPKGQAVLTA
jgi:hypothetical protein